MDLHVLEIHQRADHVLLERHRRAQLLALLDRQPLEDVVDDLLRQVVGDLRELVGLERLGRGDELVGVHRLDQRFADGVGHLDQDLAVALGLDQVPDVQPLVERQRLEDVGDVGGMQPVQLALEQHAVLPGDERLDEIRAMRVRRMRGLLVDQPFYETVLAKERGDVGERILDAPGRLGPVGRLLVEVLRHGSGRAQGNRVAANGARAFYASVHQDPKEDPPKASAPG